MREPTVGHVWTKVCCVPCLCRLMSSGLGLVNRLCAILGLKSVATLVCADRCPLASVWFFLHPNLDKDLNQRVIRITQKLKEAGKLVRLLRSSTRKGPGVWLASLSVSARATSVVRC